MMSRVDLCAFLARIGRGRFHPSTVATWERETRPSFAGCWRSGGGPGRANWYDPWAVSRWLYDRERTYKLGRELFIEGRETYTDRYRGRNTARSPAYWRPYGAPATAPRRSGAALSRA